MKLLKQHFLSSWSLLAEVEVRCCNTPYSVLFSLTHSYSDLRALYIFDLVPISVCFSCSGFDRLSLGNQRAGRLLLLDDILLCPISLFLLLLLMSSIIFGAVLCIFLMHSVSRSVLSL